MIWRVRSGSASARARSSGGPHLEPRAAPVGGRAELPRRLAGRARRGRPAPGRPPARRRRARERSSRSVVSLVSRSTCSRMVRTNSARASGSGSSSSSSSTKPPEGEDRRSQLVRGVGDELLAGAVEVGEPALHLVEGRAPAGPARRRNRPGSGSRSRRRRPSGRRPRAGSAGARGRGRRSSRRSGRGRGRSPPAIRIWRLIRATLSSTSLERLGEDRDPDRVALPGSAPRPRPMRTPPSDSTPAASAAVRPASAAVSKPLPSGAALELGVGDDEVRGALPAGGSPRIVTRESVVSETRRSSGVEPRPGRAAVHRPLDALRLLGALVLQPGELLRGEAGAKLGDNVEIDEADRRCGDRQEQEDEAGAEAHRQASSRKR